MEKPIGFCTCGNTKAEGSLYGLINEHSVVDLEKILNTELARQIIPGPLHENIIISARSGLPILLEGAGFEYRQPLNELAVMLKYKWPIGSKIKVKFIDRDPVLEPLIIKAAKEWETYAFIVFEFVENQEAEIRISLIKDDTSWSKIGTSCLEVTDQDVSTMNFGWFYPDTDRKEIKRTTLHEFGHVLGCIHEHQSPDANIPWDANKIRRVYTAAMHKSEEWVINNILGKFPTNDISNSVYDEESIMHYPIDAFYTTNGRPYGVNWDLSVQDQKFIAMCYPY
jgi:serralysin